MKVAGFIEAKNPGDFWWNSNRLFFICLCGCKSVGSVAVSKDPNDGNHPVWDWNKNLEFPTIRPSIQFMSGCHWHGFLTDGIFQSD